MVKYAVILLGSNAALKAMGYNIGLDTLVTSSSIAVGFASQSVLQVRPWLLLPYDSDPLCYSPAGLLLTYYP